MKFHPWLCWLRSRSCISRALPGRDQTQSQDLPLQKRLSHPKLCHLATPGASWQERVLPHAESPPMPGQRCQGASSGLCHAGVMQHSALAGGNSQDLRFPRDFELQFCRSYRAALGSGNAAHATPSQGGLSAEIQALGDTAISCLSNKSFTSHRILCQPIFSLWAPSSSAVQPPARCRAAASNQQIQPVWDGLSSAPPSCKVPSPFLACPRGVDGIFCMFSLASVFLKILEMFGSW